MKSKILSVLSIALFAVACKGADSKSSSSGSGSGSSSSPKRTGASSPDWGDDPRPLGSCVGTVKSGVPVPAGGSSSFCLEKQTEAECTKPSSKMDYVYAEHTTCASRGYAKECKGGDFPRSTRFKDCPAATADAPAAPAPSPNAAIAKEVVGIFDAATKAAEETKGDCKALGLKLDALRPRLWEIGKAHPNVFKGLSDAELKAIKAADSMEAITTRLPACKDNVHAKEFAYAITKVF